MRSLAMAAKGRNPKRSGREFRPARGRMGLLRTSDPAAPRSAGVRLTWAVMPPARSRFDNLLFQSLEVSDRSGTIVTFPQEGRNLMVLAIVLHGQAKPVGQPCERLSAGAVGEPFPEQSRAGLRHEEQGASGVQTEDVAMEEVKVGKIRQG